MIGDAPRTAAFGLRGPGVYNLNMVSVVPLTLPSASNSSSRWTARM
jgi:hypothetical protein